MRRRTLVLVVSTALAVLVLQGVAVLAWVYSGLYDFSATAQHVRLVQWGIETSLRRSVSRNLETAEPPYDLRDPELLELGLRLYRADCQPCHGAPGVAPHGFALGLNPVPPPLTQTARERSPAEIFWAVRNGVRMTGMPAWRFRMDRRELWAVTAFVEQLPQLSAADYRALEAREPVAARTPP